MSAKEVYIKYCQNGNKSCHYATHNTHQKKCPICRKSLASIKSAVIQDR